MGWGYERGRQTGFRKEALDGGWKTFAPAWAKEKRLGTKRRARGCGLG